MFKKFFCILLSFTLILNVTGGLAGAEPAARSGAGPETVMALAEASTGTLIFEKGGDKKVPVGMAAKLMTVLLVAEAVENGEMRLDGMKKTSPHANSMQGAQIWLMPGEEMSVSDLLKGVIIGNANDASVSLAEAVSGSEERFVEKMNLKADELGMKDTAFSNPCGYYDAEKQTSSARDLAVLAAELSEYGFLKEYFTCWRDFLRGDETELVNSNILIRDYDDMTGFKAFFSKETGYCVIAGAEREGVSYVSVILGCPDKDFSFKEARRLINYGFSGFDVLKPALPENIPQTVKVRNGAPGEVSLRVDEPGNIVIPKGTASGVTSRVFMPNYVYAPVEDGKKIGEIAFYQKEKQIYGIDIYSDGGSKEIDLKEAFVILIKNLLSF